MRKQILLTTFLALLPLFALAQVRVTARLDSAKMQIGGQNELVVEVSAKPGAHIKWPAPKDKMLSPQIEVVAERDGQEPHGEPTVRQRVYTLTVWDEGKQTVPALTVGVDGKEYHTVALPIEVETVKIDTIHPNEAKPPHDIQQLPFSWDEWWPLYLWSVLAVALAILAWVLFLRLRSGKPILRRKQTISKEPPHQKALRRISEIKTARLEGSDDQKEYYTLLTDALRRYMSERFAFNAMEMTSQEIIAHLKAEQDQTKIDELRELFATADLVKFARYAADRHVGEMYLSNVVRFIEDTKQSDTPTEIQIEQPLTAEDRSMRRRRTGVRVALWLTTLAASAITAYVLYTVYLLIL